MNLLENRTVVIVGGASGIGLGIADECAALGAKVTIVGRTEAKLEAARARLAVTTARADVTREDDVARLFRETGPVHHVVVTAVDASYPPVRELDVALARTALDTKIFGALFCAKHATFAEGASLTLTAGIAMDRPGPHASIAAAMNGALPALGRALALELSPVRVNVISPGWVDTPVWERLAGAQKAERLAGQAARLPVRRIGTPADIASAAVFLMTNGFTTGETLHVDGGHRIV